MTQVGARRVPRGRWPFPTVIAFFPDLLHCFLVHYIPSAIRWTNFAQVDHFPTHSFLSLLFETMPWKWKVHGRISLQGVYSRGDLSCQRSPFSAPNKASFSLITWRESERGKKNQLGLQKRPQAGESIFHDFHKIIIKVFWKARSQFNCSPVR